MPANEQRPAELYESLRTLHAGRPNDLKNSGNASMAHAIMFPPNKNAPARVF